MQQRRPRLGDILDDYCPRERRITNHAVVAMIDDQVKQTRCTTCDADHEYKQAKVPTARRKKLEGAAAGDAPEALLRGRPEETHPADDVNAVSETPAEQLPEEAAAESPESAAPAETSDLASDPDATPIAAAGDDEGPGDEGPGDEGPVHRRLIRATLPRPEGQVPERKMPDFTVRQPGGRGGRGEFDGNRNGQRHTGRPMRFGGTRPASGSGGQGPRHGSGQGPRHGSGPGQRPGGGNRPGQGGQRGGRPGPGGGPGQGRGGGGRKRGR